MNRKICRVPVSIVAETALTAVLIVAVWMGLEFLRSVVGLTAGETFLILLFIAAVLGLLRIRDRVGGSSPPPTLGNLYTHCFDTGYRGRGIRRFLVHWFGRDCGYSPPLSPPPASSTASAWANHDPHSRSYDAGFRVGFLYARAMAELTIRRMARDRHRHDLNARKASAAIRALELPTRLQPPPPRPDDAVCQFDVGSADSLNAMAAKSALGGRSVSGWQSGSPGVDKPL